MRCADAHSKNHDVWRGRILRSLEPVNAVANREILREQIRLNGRLDGHCFMHYYSGKIVHMDISSILRELRSSRKQSQQALATDLGVSLRAVANWESGMNPAPQYLMLLIRLTEKDKMTNFAAKFRVLLRERLGLKPSERLTL
jgi:DNA-binding transcriptional regulator YiaG